MADFVPGKMDIKQQEQDYLSFWSMMTRTGGVIIVVLILMYLFLG